MQNGERCGVISMFLLIHFFGKRQLRNFGFTRVTELTKTASIRSNSGTFEKLSWDGYEILKDNTLRNYEKMR
jgi:hypothetical protein